VRRIEDKLQAENGYDLEEGEYGIVVTAGANMGFLNAILAITNPGDEIVVLAPYYFNHEMAIGIAGCTPVVVATDAMYQPVVEDIRNALTARTRAVVTISPNNPTGAVYPPELLRSINRLCAENGIFHMHDEAYEYFLYDDLQPFSPGALADASPHTISLYSLSKAYGFASWRIGYMVVPTALLESVRKIQDTNLICPAVVSQEAAIGAMGVGKSYCTPFVRELEDVRALVLEALGRLGEKVEAPQPGGAFYALIRVRTDQSDVDLTRRLIEDFGVAVIPGSAFGLSGGCYLRIAYGALEKETVAEALGRLISGLNKLA